MAWLVKPAPADEILTAEFTPNIGNVHGESALYECLPVPGDDLLVCEILVKLDNSRVAPFCWTADVDGALRHAPAPSSVPLNSLWHHDRL